ncbi:MAG: BlaI/MecI/CopY family transcriptional regulator [Planctomycetes bacterium]|nr:BlaI/MecI/CopY family transcriptional regulator [Planctomycetota bacterium]
MKAPPRISEAEWKVMRVLWEEHPRTASQVAQALGPQAAWTDRTVKTLLARLVKKGVLSTESDGKRYLYEPAVSREACVAAEGRSFVARVFDGSASPLLLHFVKRSRLTRGEIEELRRILEEKEPRG